jgi:hypothetical protein
MAGSVVILIEQDPHEIALACTAFALHAPEVRVLEARDADAALEILGREPGAALALVGERSGALPMLKLPIPVVHIADRPRDWHAYSEFIARLLRDWVPARTGSGPRRGPPS